MRLILGGTHVRRRITQRRLALEWIERAIQEPDWTEPWPRDTRLTRSFGKLRRQEAECCALCIGEMGTIV
ncbi:MAG: DUF4258 domain-containing protein [Acetobacteraceae bacterium]|nr:DUF4258 domain-containing protein [Acetobacteraceae bacterium]